MSGYVYFFETGDGLVKIGKANNVESRFKQIQTSCPTGLKKLGNIPSDNPYELEKKTHDYFKRYRKSGEWFAIPEFLRSDIAHHVRSKFDREYRVDYRKKSNEKELAEKGYLQSGEDVNNYCCPIPDCKYENHQFVGVYDFSKSGGRYTDIVNLVECEDCKQIYGNYESHGKGCRFTGLMIVRRIPNDWKKLL